MSDTAWIIASGVGGLCGGIIVMCAVVGWSMAGAIARGLKL